MQEDKQNGSVADGAASAAHGAQAAYSVISAAKAGSAAAGAAIGTATAGPLGTVVGFLVTTKTFWKVLGSVFAAILLFIFIIVNFIGILLSYLGFMDADSFANQAQSEELNSMRSRIELILEEETYRNEILSIISQERERKLQEIEADWSANYADYTLEIVDEYETKLKDNLAYYLAIFLLEQWDESTQRSFLGYSGSLDANLQTDLTSTYDAYFEEAANTYNVPVALLLAMGQVESGFNPNVVSSAGAIGIMQLMPGTAASLGVDDPYDPRQNIMGGAKYVSQLIEQFQDFPNALELVIAGYNAGPQAVVNAGYQVPAYKETQNHVQKVMGYLTVSNLDTDGDGQDTENLDNSYALLKTAVQENVGSFFSWSNTGVEETTQKQTVYYLNTENGRTEISKDTYDELKESGQNAISEEKDIEVKRVEYTLALLLNSQLSGTASGYEYKYVLDQPTFELVLRVLQVMQDGVDALRDAFFSLFSWTDFVTGGNIEDSYVGNIDVTGDVIHYDTVGKGVKEVVYFNQLEEPWASLPYASSTIEDSGCGPTSMAIVISTLTGNNVTPEMTKSFAENNGEYVPGQGTSHSFIGNAAAHWGLTCERVGKDRMDDVVQALKEGKMVVEICEAYTITGGSSGHFIVLTGVTRDGYITIADCASRERTGKVYSVETIKSYGRDLSAGAFWIIGK
ncbi:transglycosylase SLT domain-containing protein [Lachnospiraceae bacterium DSM 108991]|uniref:Transglycosylase SLT domain-containing protein n=1 Tax=Claveliimonas monacensis TaxID=2779351 RepID=A0ABR9RLY4_9FIRM|nr:transglycosylase SLT domain-containing protein [Claveliimonas monacensis]MBE5063987.1 transglycosylase SLT domain-containing protein [Claveliimonas monacensis]